MPKLINCACGQTVQGDSDDEVLDKAEEHVRSNHADEADQPSRAELRSIIEEV